MVGEGFYGVDECGQSQAAIPGTLSTAIAGRFGFLWLARARGSRAASRTGTRTWHWSLLLLALLVRRWASAAASLWRSSEIGETKFPILSELGQSYMERPLVGRGREENHQGTNLSRQGRPSAALWISVDCIPRSAVCARGGEAGAGDL